MDTRHQEKKLLDWFVSHQGIWEYDLESLLLSPQSSAFVTTQTPSCPLHTTINCNAGKWYHTLVQQKKEVLEAIKTPSLSINSLESYYLKVKYLLVYTSSVSLQDMGHT